MLTVAGTRFISITTCTNGDETTNLTFPLQKCRSLYESTVVASIFDDDGLSTDSLRSESGNFERLETKSEECGEKRKEKTVLSDINDDGDLLAVAIGEDISIFTFDCGTRFVVTIHLGDDINPVAMKFMPIVNLIAVVTNCGNVLFLSVGSNRILHQVNLVENKRIQCASISCDVQLEDACMCVVLESGEIYSFFFPNYLKYFHREQEIEVEIYNRQKGMATMIWKKFDIRYSGRDCAIISHLNAILLLSAEQNGKLALLDLSAEISGEAVDEFYSADVSDIVRIRHFKYRDRHTSRIILQFIIALTVDGQLLIWDSATTVLVSSNFLLKTGEIAKDFMLFGYTPGKEGRMNENTKLVLLFIDHEGFQIRSLRTREIIYTKSVSNKTLLLNKVTREEGLVLFVQLFAYECRELNAVKIHAVYECQPEMRLNHLLDQHRWAEAEEFAHIFNLSMEKIYVARIEHFVDTGTMSQTDLEIHDLENFLEWMTHVSDQNWVAEMCIASIMYCSNHSWVKKILDLVNNLEITDGDTKEKLALMRYNYQSYREVLGPWRKPCSSKILGIDLWSEFLGGCSWEHIFEFFCKNGQFCEARLLWYRYRKTLEDWIKEKENFERLLTEIHLTVHDANGDIMEAIQFLEDIIPVMILHDPETCCLCCKSFLMNIAHVAEIRSPECFPENSLKIASTMERVAQNLLNSSATPCRQAEVAYALSVTRCYSWDPNDLMGELNVYVRDLRSMKKLKDVYQCRMSYNTYQEQTVESICYVILERVKSVQLIKSNIDQYARPYMDEFKLDADRTLYNYILKIATSSAGVVSSSNPWDERCLAVAESISHLGLRCEALIGVAKRAHPPWTKQLSGAVYVMLKNPEIDLKLASRLQQQCDFAALGERMIQYRFPMQTLEKYLQQKHLFNKAIEFIFRQESVEADPQRRLVGALEIIKLAEKLKKDLMEYNECIFRFCIYLISAKWTEDWFLDIVSCISNLNETDRNRVLSRLTSHAEALLNCPVLLQIEKEKQIRLRTVEAVSCILERFGKDEVLRSELSAVRKLQIDHGIVTRLSSLKCNAWKSAELKHFLNGHFTGSGVPAKITEFIKISNALMMEENITYEVALLYALENRSPLAALEYAKFAIQDLKKPSEKLLKLIVQSCSYGLWIMSELAENSAFEPIFVIFGSLSDLLSNLIEATCQNFSLSASVFHIALFVHLFETIVSQCMSESLVEENEYEDEKACLIYGLRRRVGVYLYRMDGTLFKKSDAIQQLSVVARSVVFDVLKSTDLIDADSSCNLSKYYESMRSAWGNFFSYLSLNNQILIGTCARFSFALLPCYVISNQVAVSYSELHGMIELFMERALVYNYADFELCASLIFSVPFASIKKILIKTRSWCMTRKSPHVVLNLIRLARFCAVHYYALSLWIKKLGRLNANFPQNISLAATVQEFVRCLIPPGILIEFCKDFSLEITEALVLYATKMALKASTEEDQMLAADMRLAVSTALQEIDVTENLFMQLYACLMALSPYCYEIRLINGMEKYIDEDNSDQVEILRRASITIRFLEVSERVNPPTDHEIRWYHERQKFLCKHQGGNHDSTVKVSDGEELITVEECGSESLYKKTNLLFDQLPSRAYRRLPFHPFMFENEKDLQNTLLPMIHAELTLSNVDIFVRALPEIEISKSDLLSSAVLLAVQTSIAKGIDVEENDIERIRQLVRNTTNRLRTLQGLTEGFKHLPLSKTKLRFLLLGIDVIKEWLAESKQKLLEKEENIGFLKHFLHNLEEAYKSYNTEFVLKKYGLLRAETLDLIFTPQNLIEHIYVNEIDWSNCKEINGKIPCTVELADILAVDLDAIQDRIIHQWLEWNTEANIVFDPNETNSSDVPLTPMVVKEICEEVYKLPYADPIVSRIVELSLLRGPKKAYALKNVYQQGSHEGKIRSVCCLLRLLRPEQFPEVVKSDLRNVCSVLEIMLYSRMIDVYEIDLEIEIFHSAEKSILLKSLLNNSRQTSQLTLFVASVTIDFQLLEPSMIDLLLNKLYLERKVDILIELLNYCATNNILSHIKNIEQKWLYAAQWLFSTLKESANKKQEFDKFLLFSVSCPVEFGPSASALLHLLERKNFPVAHRLLMLASSAVAKEADEGSEICLENSARSSLDFSLKWQC
uniref:RZZ complex subunit KNTC1/ROD C-terminal domain-containing protein n=1 Tax=Setaria digitata TaxID=48799 RepID=A0A915Q0R4_9BILA